MTDKKTSAESAAGTLDGTELVRIVQSGSNAKTTTQDIADLGGGGGPGGYFQLESGSSPLKVSAFTAATAPDGTELIPGVQGGANVAFTTAQLLTTKSGTAASNDPGTYLYLQAGAGDGSGKGGETNVYGGQGGATSGNGGNLNIRGGYAPGTGQGGELYLLAGKAAHSGRGGKIQLYGGYSNTGYGGNVAIKGGISSTGAYGGSLNLGGGGAALGKGGDVTIAVGPGNTNGHITITLLSGSHLTISGLPISNAGLTSGMIWANSNVLTVIP